MNQEPTDEPSQSRNCRRPEWEELERAFVLHHNLVFNFVHSVIHTPHWAEDVVQDTFIKVAELGGQGQWPGYSVDSSGFVLWLKRVARNMAFNRARFEGRRNHESLDVLLSDVLGGPLSPAKTLEMKELQTLIDDAIGNLTAIQRQAFQLVRLQGLRYQEAADSLGIPIGSLKGHLQRATQFIKEALTARLT